MNNLNVELGSYQGPSLVSNSENLNDIDWNSIQSTIQDILDENFSTEVSEKRRLKFKSDSFHFACPYCGDSQTDVYKKRAHLYFNTATFHCYNCGKRNALDYFLKDFDKKCELSLSDIRIIRNKKILNTRSFVTNSSFLFANDFLNSVLPSINEVVDTLKLLPLSWKLKKWLSERFQKIDDRFWMDSKLNLVIFNLINDKVLGYQIRNFTSFGPKYDTYTFKKLLVQLNRNISIEVLEDLDSISTIYGYLTIDWNKPIVCFEGPLDSFLVDNSVALSSAHRNIDAEFGEWKFVFDNDSTGKSKALEWANNGYPVFLWRKVFEHFGITIKDQVKDYTDLIHFMKNKGIKFNLHEWFSATKYDIFWL